MSSIAGLSICIIFAWFTLIESGTSSAEHTGKVETNQTIDDEFLKNYLTYVGYLPLPLFTPGHDDDRNVTDGLVRLQRFAGLEPTGRLDSDTLDLLARPRCGVPDVFEFRMSFSMWHKHDLTYCVNATYQNMTQDTLHRAIKDAWNVWAAVSSLTFRKVALNEDPDIVINFYSGNHNDGAPFDGQGGVLGHAFSPTMGLVHLDKDEKWSAGPPISSGNIDLFIVAAHEFGHALGLMHTGVPGALMFPYYMGYVEEFQLPDDDIWGIQFLYGANPSTAERMSTNLLRTTHMTSVSTMETKGPATKTTSTEKMTTIPAMKTKTTTKVTTTERMTTIPRTDSIQMATTSRITASTVIATVMVDDQSLSNFETAAQETINITTTSRTNAFLDLNTITTQIAGESGTNTTISDDIGKTLHDDADKKLTTLKSDNNKTASNTTTFVAISTPKPDAVAGKPRRRGNNRNTPLSHINSCTGVIDASVSSSNGSFTFIFSDSFLWYQASSSEMSLITESGLLNPRLPRRPDAALFFAFTVFIFEGCHVWRMDRHNEHIMSVHSISELWNALPCNVDAAYRSNKDGYIYFFKDGLAYKYIGRQKVKGPVTLTDLGWTHIPDRLNPITAVRKTEKYTVHFVTGSQFYQFNDNTKTFVNGEWPKYVVPNLLPSCHGDLS